MARDRITDIRAHAAERLPVLDEILATEGGHFLPRDPQKTVDGQDLLYLLSYFNPRRKVSGKEQIFPFYRSEAPKKVVILNHGTDADPVALRWALSQEGKDYILDDGVFVGGINMVARPHIKRFMGMENLVLIPTPHEINALNEALKGKEPGEEEVLEQYLAGLTTLGKRAYKTLAEQRRAGKHIFLFPEAGRTYDEQGYIDWAPDEVGSHVDVRGTRVLPMVMTGVRDKFPPHRLPTWSPFKMTLDIGEPFDGPRVLNVDKNLYLNDRPANRGTALMSEIAHLNPSIVRPEEQEFYYLVRESLNPNTPRHLRPRHFYSE